MKKRNPVALGKAFTLLFCACLLAESTACASKKAVSTQTASSTEVPSEEAEISDSEVASSESTNTETESNTEISAEETSSDTEKEKVWDYDALVNEEFLKKAEAKINDEGYNHYSLFEESNELLCDRIVDIFENTDISTLPEDNGLYKAISVYNQLIDENWQNSSSIAAVIEKLSVFDSINTLEDLYDISTDSFYGSFNCGLHREVIYDQGYSINRFRPVSFCSNEMSDNQKEALKLLFMNLGYEESRADEIVANTVEIDKLLSDYINTVTEKESLSYFGQADLDA